MHHGVPEYWLVDLGKKEVGINVLQEKKVRT
ncbi:MAG: hypothetical protein H6577_09145 [Lewinellaceae bacterium]|nr:hypothetical protein [Saprospiraceae bacterium]MCB9338280.1 hypothetical protein [Lewinellaceae bacterium]